MTNASKVYRLIYSLDRCLTEKYKNMSFEMLKKYSNEFYMTNVLIDSIKDMNDIYDVSTLTKLDYFIDRPEELLQRARYLTKSLVQEECDIKDYFVRVLEGEQQ